jgi:hypothetical protein
LQIRARAARRVESVGRHTPKRARAPIAQRRCERRRVGVGDERRRRRHDSVVAMTSGSIPREVHGHILLEAEGCVDRDQHLLAYRALSRHGPAPRLVVTGRHAQRTGEAMQLARALSLRRTSAVDANAVVRAPIPDVVETWSENGEALAIPYLPGVSLAALVAQTRSQGAVLAGDVAAALLCKVAEASSAYNAIANDLRGREKAIDLEKPGTRHVRVGFDGDVVVFASVMYNDLRGGAAGRRTRR